MSDPSAQPGTPLHGPGGLLGAPGLRKGRKWGMRTKATKIVGNLYRANDGKFSAGGDNPVAAKPQRGNVLSRQPQPTARPKPAKVAPPKKGGGGKAPKPKDPSIAARQAQRDQERTSDRAQRQADRQTRLERLAKRDAEHDADRAKRQQAAVDKLTKPEKAAKPAKAGGGGSKKPKDDKSKVALDTAGSVGISPDDLGALRDAADGLGGHGNATLTKLGLIGPDGMATDQGRRALSALERGNVRQYQAAIQDAQARLGRETGARDRKQAAEGRRTAAAQERQAKQQRQAERLKRRAMAGGKLTSAQMDQAMEAGVMGPDGTWKSFAVFKDHAGALRWLARTTTAYRDRDGEIISVAALDADSQRMMATKQFGPLRYWHIGQPDPLNDAAPWGPGVDIGDCDYSVVIGRTRIESGTFRSAAIAQKMAKVADRHEMSPGFLHPIDQPDSDGVFDSIRTFERSPVPLRYGRASNLFTGFTVKEFRMEVSEMERRFKAMYVELGLTPEQGVELGQNLVATEKAAAAQGIAFKSEAVAEPAVALPPPTIYYGPDNQPGIISGGMWVALKAAPPAVEEMIETQADDPMAAITDEEVIEPEMEPAGEFVGDLTPDAFFAKLDEHLAPLIKMQDVLKALNDGVGELKSMQTGTTTKESGAIAQLAAQLAEIQGNQPAVILPDEVAAAFKSDGPATADPDAVEVPNDPSRPLAALAARTMPALYRTGPAGEFAGWTPPPAV